VFNSLNFTHPNLVLSVYTPAFVVDGQEWKRWSSGLMPEQSRPTNLQLSVSETTTGDFEVAVDGLVADGGDYTIRIAKLGMGLSANITGGENSGRLLERN
jgi:hypothetical protein